MIQFHNLVFRLLHVNEVWSKLLLLMESMADEFMEIEITCDITSGSLVHIFGPNIFQNKLLISFLERDTRLKCRQGADLCMSSIIDDDPTPRQLVLADCLGNDVSWLWSELSRMWSSLEINVDLYKPQYI